MCVHNSVAWCTTTITAHHCRSVHVRCESGDSDVLVFHQRSIGFSFHKFRCVLSTVYPHLIIWYIICTFGWYAYRHGEAKLKSGSLAATFLQFNCIGQNVKNTIKPPIAALIASTLQLIIITIDSILIEKTNKLDWIEKQREKRAPPITQHTRNSTWNSRKIYLHFMAIVKILSLCNQTS